MNLLTLSKRQLRQISQRSSHPPATVKGKFLLPELNDIYLHYIFRIIEDDCDSPDVAVIEPEDELNLDELMRQKELLQACLASAISDSEHSVDELSGAKQVAKKKVEDSDVIFLDSSPENRKDEKRQRKTSLDRKREEKPKEREIRDDKKRIIDDRRRRDNDNRYKEDLRFEINREKDNERNKKIMDTRRRRSRSRELNRFDDFDRRRSPDRRMSDKMRGRDQRSRDRDVRERRFSRERDRRFPSRERDRYVMVCYHLLNTKKSNKFLFND